MTNQGKNTNFKNNAVETMLTSLAVSAHGQGHEAGPRHGTFSGAGPAGQGSQ